MWVWVWRWQALEPHVIGGGGGSVTGTGQSKCCHILTGGQRPRHHSHELLFNAVGLSHCSGSSMLTRPYAAWEQWVVGLQQLSASMWLNIQVGND